MAVGQTLTVMEVGKDHASNYCIDPNEQSSAIPTKHYPDPEHWNGQKLLIYCFCCGYGTELLKKIV